MRKVRKGKGLVNSFINNLPFEMHLPGHQFTGPGTRLNKRLNEDLTAREWSKPINRVDQAAYKHDVCYLKNKDTKTRNDVCDKDMVDELDNIEDPTIRERIERGIVRPIINTKRRFGLGIQSHINMDMYCVKCRRKTESKDVKEITNKRGRPMLSSLCAVCGIKKFQFIKSKSKINEQSS